MALPITCPGCSAAFEVPDNLAGKTIRCTSCKTQLTVPATAPVATAAPGSGVKKPFGWAANGAAAAAPEPMPLEPEPLPLDDEPAPVAKQPAKAVPVAKPVAKAVVADDEDEKTNPSKSANKKSGTTAKATTKKRRDDDDDDYDDDQDQPRRKKKNQ